ncbi:MAG: phage holin family protein [Dehalococcoidales bacterium]|nr:phage holin family protein [Dehalococcoidales bacterium]
MKRRLIVRRIVVWILVSLVIFLTGFLTQLYAHNAGVAVFVTAGLGLADALLWPVLSMLSLPFTIITFGLGALLLNAALFWEQPCFSPKLMSQG